MYFREVKNPRIGIEYWVVIDSVNNIQHYFRNECDAFEFSSWHNIPDILVYKECFN